MSVARLLVACTAGNAIEFYDFFLYASATALVFGKVFFPADGPLTSVFAAFGVYAGLYARLRIDETPLFRKYQQSRGMQRRLPLAEVFGRYQKGTFVVLFYRIGENTVYYIFTIFMIVSVTDGLHLGKKGIALTRRPRKQL